MDLSDSSIQPSSTSPENEPTEQQISQANGAMDEYRQFQNGLILSSAVIAGLLFGPIWWIYSLKVASSYLLGASSGVLYLRILAKNVEQLGTGKTQVGKNQLGIFVVLIIVATQWNQLEVLPIFLGFLTYKVGIFIFVLWTAVLSPSTAR
ncbi:ATP synthase subunit I [Acaryochloris sp. IP29b_bin.137]|uniref:ATP synthase subunit I n=1 Tax=Acaryochloris sp. IP29b_bin.137 TaxID=2969217 RepID=UPI002602A13B|nr:ATP synthase subunit I [Acaryochloris sp. IP29b_bin.137]